MQLCLYFLFVTVGAQPLFSGQPGLPVAPGLYGQAVLAESVLCQCFPEFIIFHCGEIICHSVLSF